MGWLNSILDWVDKLVAILAALAAHDNRLEFIEEEEALPGFESPAATLAGVVSPMPVPEMVRIDR